MNSVIDLILILADVVHKADKYATLTHEHVRSDHIAVLFDAKVDKSNEKGPTINVRSKQKADWTNGDLNVKNIETFPETRHLFIYFVFAHKPVLAVPGIYPSFVNGKCL